MSPAIYKHIVAEIHSWLDGSGVIAPRLLLQSMNEFHQRFDLVIGQFSTIGRHFGLAFLTISKSSVSESLATSGECRSLAPIFWPAGVSPFPLTPWQLWHFA